MGQKNKRQEKNKNLKKIQTNSSGWMKKLRAEDTHLFCTYIKYIFITK